jgi:CubicO group peptidase (beta-lactamase class C family)
VQTKLFCAVPVAGNLSFPVAAQNLPKAGRRDEVGFSTERLKRLSDAFQSDVDRSLIPGAVVLIAREGKIALFEAFGFQDREKRIPMKPDSIFRIASMTKPITSVALMMLAEEGKSQIDDPLSLSL